MMQQIVLALLKPKKPVDMATEMVILQPTWLAAPRLHLLLSCNALFWLTRVCQN
jgi:hypothetical protein